MTDFKSLGLSQTTQRVLESLNFTTPTPIQEQAIPLLLSENSTDFIGLAQTGTGKTAAFGLPLMDLIDAKSKATQVLIMAPTRELGQQTGTELKKFSADHGHIKVEVVYGGASISAQIQALKKSTQVIVATPGRLLDLIRRKAIKLDEVRYVVLDEADEMLNMGFKEDIDEILSYTPEEKVTWLFSATMPKEIRKIVKKYMTDPKEVSVITNEKSNKDIAHKYVITKTANKLPALKRFLDIQPEMRGIMFCRTRRETQEISDQLANMGYGVEALHGDLSQAQRNQVMGRFKNRGMQLLIATDVAARGIDVNDLTHVLHHKLPDQLEAYTHRSGRTGRAGKKGISIAFINDREQGKIKELQKKIGIEFEAIQVPSAEELKSSRISNWANLITNVEVDKQADAILHNLWEKFENISKEDLLKRLITTQLDHLSISKDDMGDLNEIHAGDGKRTGGKNKEFNRYFVNLGSIDGVTKGDLLHFLSDVSGIKRRDFGDISLQKNCAFFDVSSTQDKGLSEKFKGISIEGRSVRVNRDGDRKEKEKGSEKNQKDRYGKKKFHKGKSRPKSKRDSRRRR